MNDAKSASEPSMDEILASIRKIISEDTPEPTAAAVVEIHNASPAGSPEADRDVDFDLPSILRPSQASTTEKPAPLLGRLADAIRGNGTSTADAARSLEDDLADLLDEAPAAAAPEIAGTETRAATGTGSADASVTGQPQTRQLLASLDHSLALFSEAQSSRAADPASGRANHDAEARFMPAPEVTETAERPSAGKTPSVSRYTFPTLKRPADSDGGSSIGHGTATPKPVVIAAMPNSPGRAGTNGAPGFARPLDNAPERPATAARLEAVQALAEKASAANPETVTTALNALTAGVAAFRDQHGRARATAPVTDAGSALVRTSPAGSSVSAASDASARLSPATNRTLDDAVTELLRPMLRQWLDDNMPRIIEAALKTEIADLTASKTASGKR